MLFIRRPWKHGARWRGRLVKKFAGYEDIAYGGLYLILLLFIVNIPLLNAIELLRLVMLAALLAWTAGSDERLSRLSPLALPFVLVFCAAQFDPSLGISQSHKTSGIAAPGPYRPVLSILSATLLAVSLAWWKKVRHGEFPDRLDAWVIGCAVIAAAYNILARAFYSQGAAANGDVAMASFLFLVYGALFISARIAFSGTARAKTYTYVLSGLFVLAALTGAVRAASAGYYYLDAMRLNDKGKTSEARAALADASDIAGGLSLDRLDARIEYQKGLSYYYDNKYGDAIKSAEAASRLDGGYYLTYQLEGASYALLGRWDEAIRAYETARRLAPSKTGYYPFLAVAYSWTRQWERGGFLRDYKEPLDEGVAGAENMAILAAGDNKWGRYNEAERLSGKAIELGLRTDTVYFQRGVAEEGLGKYDEAQRDYRAAISIAPGHAIGAYARLAGLYRKAGSIKESEAMKADGLRLETIDAGLGGFNATAGIYRVDDHLAFFVNGSAANKILLYKGKFSLEITARGEPAGNEYPACEVWLDSRMIGTVHVNSREWKVYAVPFGLNDADGYELGIHYVNDAYLPGQDRNLFIREVSLRRASDAE